MYHYCDSVDHAVLLDEGQWHRLDNIGSLLCFTVIFTFLMHNENVDLDNFINYSEFFLHLLLQEASPWYVPFTIVPVVWAGCRPLLKMLIYRKPNPFNRKNFTRGLFFLFVAFFCFTRGLDDDNDFLRIWHGLWHSFVGLSSFYLWQSLPVKGEKDIELFQLLPQPAKIKH
jgi:hypothetical protein